MNGREKATYDQRKASDPSASAWVNANAGSGKTHVLVDRVIRLILSGTEPSRLLCLTFTKAAAAEMAGRIFQRLANWVVLPGPELVKELESLGITGIDDELLVKARRLFAATQETPGGLKIQTIHAFCERLLQLFPVEAGIVPHFGVLDDRMAQELRAASRDAVLTRGVTEPDAPLGQALARVTSLVSQDQFDDLLQQMLSQAESWYEPRNPLAQIECIAGDLRNHLGLAPGDDESRIKGHLGIDIEKYRKLHAVLSTGSKSEAEQAAILETALEAASPTLLGVQDFYLTKGAKPRAWGRFPAADTKKSHPWIPELLGAEQSRLIAGLERLADLERVSATEALLTIAAGVLQDYEGRKRQRALYDFDDLIARTRALLAERPDAAWVLYKLDGGIDHVLIDEAQDTSPAQWDIVQSLTGEFFSGAGSRPDVRRTMFAVGDRKQSIYSFQGADPDVFEVVHDGFKERIEGAGLVFNDVNLTVSFRSAPEVLEAVDAVFHEESPARRGLDGRTPAGIQHDSTRLAERGIVEIWPVVEPDEKDEPEAWAAPVDKEPANAPPRKLARHIAATLKSWIGKRRIGNSERIVAAGDILVLVRQRKSFFDSLISELRQAGIAVAGADRLKLRDSIAILDLLALGAFAVLPEDDHSLACILKSPLLETPVTEDELFDLCHGRGGASLWQKLQHSATFRTATEQLKIWEARAAYLPPFEFFASVLHQRRTAFVERLGFEVNDALDAFLQAALDHGQDRAPSLAAFLAWFNEGDIEIKRNMEQGRNEVRVMTVHGAKGLEAPIVILPDTTGVPENRSRPKVYKIPVGNARRTVPLWAVPKLRDSTRTAELKVRSKDQDFEEYHRLLYVAMTRARDELYICGYKGERDVKDGGWHQRVSDALASPEKMRLLSDGVWRMGVDPLPAAAGVSAASEAIQLPAWINTQVAPTHAPAARSVTALTKEAEEPVQQDYGARGRGIVVHRLLQLLPETPEPDRQTLARQIAARAGQPESLADEVLALLSLPSLAPLFEADGLSEVALSAPLPELDTQVSGRIDRLIVGGNTITIVDFKTDRNWPRSLDQVPAGYARQMALYRKVMENAYPGRPVTCLLVWTAAPAAMELPSSFLDQALARLMAAPT